MRTRRAALCKVLGILLFVLSPSFLDAQLPATDRQRLSSLENVQVHSVALESNKLGDPADQPVAIYLPPSYKTSPTIKISSPLPVARI